MRSQRSREEDVILIAISSWENAAVMGYHQAARETFLKDIAKYPELEYKFFVGDGNPTGEDETALTLSFAQVIQAHGASKAAFIKPESFTPQDDEIILPETPDDYKHNAYKVRNAHRWAAGKYDYIFQCTSDTYIHLDRLMNSGFQGRDWAGCPEPGNFYTRGGNGYWLRGKTSKLILDEPVTLWAEDWWVGTVLRRNKVVPTFDTRYAERPEVPRLDNNIISSHLGWPTYDVEMMYGVHAALGAS